MKKILSLIFAACLIFIGSFFIEACKDEDIKNKVVFYVDGQEYAYFETNGNEEIKLPDDPTKDGYVFNGWYLFEDKFNEKAYTEKTISTDISVYAKWEKLYSITTQCTNGGTIYITNTNSLNNIKALEVIEFIIIPETKSNMPGGEWGASGSIEVEYYSYMLLGLNIQSENDSILYVQDGVYQYNNWEFTKYKFVMPRDNVNISAIIMIIN